MKSLFFSGLLLQVVFGQLPGPSKNPSQPTGEDTARPPPASAAPLPVISTQCKVIPGDPGWPADDVWKKEIPGVVKSEPASGKTTRPDWVINAKRVEEVQAAVNFAAKHNVRVSIINGGHDFLGRNDAPNGLWINVGNIKGSRVDQSYTPTANGTEPVDHKKDCVRDINKIQWDRKSQAAVTFGAGCSSQDMTDALDKSGLFMIVASASTVKPAGGFGQTAGHSVFSTTYGLGVDNILEFKVVTADGKYVVANQNQNTPLYQALRGGGGGSWGVVVEATFKAHKTPRIIATEFYLEPQNKNDMDSIYDPAAYLHSQFPSLNNKKVQGYYYVYPSSLLGGFMIPDGTIEEARKLWEPVLAKLESYPNMKKSFRLYQEFKSYKQWFDLFFGKQEELKAGEELYPEPPAPHGIIPLDSWLIGTETLKHPQLAKALKVSMPNITNGMLRGHLIAGGNASDTVNGAPYVNPAWRKALVHIIGTGTGGVPNISAIKAIEPQSGSYSNEDLGTAERDWKRVMWGARYEPLLKIKHAVDPNGLFWVTPGIGADEFQVKDGRLCRVAPDAVKSGNATMFAPANDNHNMGSGTGYYKPFPGT